MVLVDELPMEFHCALQLHNRSRNVNGITVCSSIFGATISDAVARSSSVFCNSVSAHRIIMAASRLLRAVAAFVILVCFAAGSRKSYWSGCMKAATVICQQIFSILALVIFFLKIL